ncbi:DNA polymerase IV [Alkalihalophilus lindianensis]|uniref:DNA polymerase IV n=1 Tax=Alkalihalophilus lindianensis TaxID=1630542 RepID=A0ABU3X5S9_9BACI|nr:DNA polymerase IV [Alkalihalophilus lindianensis]MDV2683250.1 DNA polymerase IV [Alkalihalophilus lindianensis]
MSQRRVIFHIDMNSFYASVEMSYDPTLRGKPLAIAGNVEERRGIIVTSSYEARAKGVKTTMPVWRAKRLCPELLLMKPNHERYRQASRALFELLGSYTPLVQPVSIDEGYLDVTSYLPIKHPYELAKDIQTRIKLELDLPCSIGIAPNKFLAKMASDMKKPNGITILRKRDIKQMLWPLPISEMYGIGRRTVDKWEKRGIKTIGDLANANQLDVQGWFGTNGRKLHDRANGIDDRPVDPEAIYEFKTIGHSTTLKQNTKNMALIERSFESLAESVSKRLKKKEVLARGIQVTIRYHDWKTVTRSQKVTNPIQSSEEIFEVATALFTKAWNQESVRLIGISSYDLIEQQHAYKQLDLFHYKEDMKEEKIANTLKEIHARFGEDILHKGTASTWKSKDESARESGSSFRKDFLEPE